MNVNLEIRELRERLQRSALLLYIAFKELRKLDQKWRTLWSRGIEPPPPSTEKAIRDILEHLNAPIHAFEPTQKLVHILRLIDLAN